MAKKPQDIFMNWFALDVTAEAAASSLGGDDENTAAGAAMNIGWRIHQIEWYPSTVFTASSELTLAISTRKSLAAMPALGAKGLLAKFKLKFALVTDGVGYLTSPVVREFLPPMIIASPSLSMYCQCSTDDVSQRAAVHEARIGFTMTQLDARVYQELFATWNFAD